MPRRVAATHTDKTQPGRTVRPFRPEDVGLYPPAIGVDEAGRGALCGPVVVAAVWFEPERIPAELLAQLDDSKRLTVRMRDDLAAQLPAHARIAIAAASADTIDRRGIRTMTLDAMRRAILRLGLDAPVKIDGLDVPPGIPLACTAVVQGDRTVPQIAAASIIAKSCRDRLMARLAVRHPGYCWDSNAGYGTAEHLEALDRLGPTRHHRWSFQPLSQFTLALDV